MNVDVKRVARDLSVWLVGFGAGTTSRATW